MQAHAALYRHEYEPEVPPFKKPVDAAIKDAIISKALIHAIHSRNGQHFVEPQVRPFDSDAQPWLSSPEIQSTMSMLERTGVNFCGLHLHKKMAPDGRECYEIHEAPENKKLTDAQLDIMRKQFGDRSADMVSRSYIDNSKITPYAGQHIAWGIEELITDPGRPSRYPFTPEQMAVKKARLDARMPTPDSME